MKFIGNTEKKQKEEEIKTFFNGKIDEARSYYLNQTIFYGSIIAISLLTLFAILDDYNESGYYEIIMGKDLSDITTLYIACFVAINIILVVEFLRNWIYYIKIDNGYTFTKENLSIIEKGKDNYEGCGVYPFLAVSLFLATFFKADINNDNDEKIKSCLHESHKCLGMIYGREINSEYTKYQVGKDVMHLRNQSVKLLGKQYYDVGDTIILRVSDDFPRVNKVLSWNPTAEEKVKYRTPVKLLEK